MKTKNGGGMKIANGEALKINFGKYFSTFKTLQN